MVVTGHTVHGGILRHGGHHHAVLQREAAHGVGREHGWRRRFVGRHRDTGLLGKPALVTTQPLRVTQAQVLVRDTLRASQHRVHELFGWQGVGIALAHHLEPGHGVPRGVLQAQHIDVAQLLVTLQHLGNFVGSGTLLLELACEFDRVFDGEFGAGANRKVGRMHRVTHQHHMAVAVVQRPLVTLHALEVEPGGAAQVARIGHQRVAAQVGGKQLFAEGHRLVGA